MYVVCTCCRHVGYVVRRHAVFLYLTVDLTESVKENGHL